MVGAGLVALGLYMFYESNFNADLRVCRRANHRQHHPRRLSVIVMPLPVMVPIIGMESINGFRTDGCRDSCITLDSDHAYRIEEL